MKFKIVLSSNLVTLVEATRGGRLEKIVSHYFNFTFAYSTLKNAMLIYTRMVDPFELLTM